MMPDAGAEEAFSRRYWCRENRKTQTYISQKIRGLDDEAFLAAIEQSSICVAGD